MLKKITELSKRLLRMAVVTFSEHPVIKFMPKTMFSIEPVTLAALIGAGGSIGGALLSGGGGGSTVAAKQQEDLLSEKLFANRLLNEFAQTGKLGEYQAGVPYEGSFGDFNLTDLQKMSLDKLTGLLGSGLPATYGVGKNILTDFVGEDYNPYTSDLYKGFRVGAQRETQEAQDALRRSQAVTGDLYSTNNARESGLLQERLGLGLQNKLAQLADTNVQRRLGVASDLTQLGLQEEDVLTKRIGLGVSLGDIERQLRTQEAQAKYAEFQRQRGEWQQTVQAAQGVAGVGVPSVGGSGGSGSPFASFINQGLALAGQGLGKYLGKSGNTTGNTTNYQGSDYSLSSPGTLSYSDYLKG